MSPRLLSYKELLKFYEDILDYMEDYRKYNGLLSVPAIYTLLYLIAWRMLRIICSVLGYKDTPMSKMIANLNEFLGDYDIQTWSFSPINKFSLSQIKRLSEAVLDAHRIFSYSYDDFYSWLDDFAGSHRIIFVVWSGI